VAELLVALNADRAAQDVAQAVQPHVPQMGHLEDDQGVAEEEVGAADDGEVGKEIAQALQPVDAEKEQVLGDHQQAGEAEPPKVLGARGEHQQDLQVALDDGAVLQLLELGDVIADVHAATDCGGERGTRWAVGTGQHPPITTQGPPCCAHRRGGFNICQICPQLVWAGGEMRAALTGSPGHGPSVGAVSGDANEVWLPGQPSCPASAPGPRPSPAAHPGEGPAGGEERFPPLP